MPWLGFIDKMRQADVLVLLDDVQFEKNYFQNRNRIRTPSQTGWTWLTVPVLTKSRYGQTIRDVEVNNVASWKRKHLLSLELHYRRAPYFRMYWDVFASLYATPWEYLVDLNVAFIDRLEHCFGLPTETIRSSELKAAGRRTEKLVSICLELGATHYLSGISGRDYLDLRLFHEASIEVIYQEFRHPIYRQCYSPFIAAMSSVDLLFNRGPEALSVLTSHETPRLTSAIT